MPCLDRCELPEGTKVVGASAPHSPDRLALRFRRFCRDDYRILTSLAAELLAAAAQQELPQLDEKLYLQVFGQPERTARRRAGGAR